MDNLFINPFQMRIRNSDLERAVAAKAIIEKEYFKHYSYQELATFVGTNAGKLQTAFKVVTKKNLYEYLTVVRVEKAIELLENTELKVEAIACKVGWDRSNLNKHFKRIMGESPSKWRLIKEKK